MQIDWTTGVEFGRAIERLRHHDVMLQSHAQRLDEMEQGHEDMQGKIRTLREWLIRGALLVLLFMAVLGGQLTVEQAGEFAGTTLKNLIRK